MNTRRQHSNLPYTLHIGKRRIPVADLHDASVAYQSARDESGKGASEWPDGDVYRDTTLVARVSYNGRVWAPTPWKPDDAPLLEAAKRPAP